MTPTLARLANAYHAHHFKCQHCIAAGIRGTQRCPVGRPLWLAYQKAV